MDYLEQLVRGLERLETIDKFDALMSILCQRVSDVQYKETVESIEPLRNLLTRAVGALYKREFITDEDYNDPVDVERLSDVQRAYLCGKMSALLDLTTLVYAKRPLEEELSFAKANLDVLVSVGDDFVPHQPEIHYDFLNYGLMIGYKHGFDTVCKLTPFAKSLIAQRKT